MSIDIVHTEGFRADNVVIKRGDECWLTFGARWWQVARWIWWWLTPGLKAMVQVKYRIQGNPSIVRVRAVRLSRTSVVSSLMPIGKP